MGTPNNPLTPGDVQPQADDAANVSGKLNETLDNLRSAVESQNSVWEKVLDFMKEVNGYTEKVGEGYAAAAVKAEDLVDATANLRSNLKAVVEATKSFGSSLSKKTFAEAAAELARIQKASQDLLQNSKATVQQQAWLKRTIRDCADGVAKLNAHQSDSNKKLKGDVALYKEMEGLLHNISDKAHKFNDVIGSVRVGGLNKAVMSMNMILGRGPGKVEKAHRAAQSAHELREARKAKKAGHHKAWDASRKSLEEDLSRDMPDEVLENGVFSSAKFRKSDKAKQYAAELLTRGENGEAGGFLDRMLTRYALGGKGGLAGEGGMMKAVKAGGGSAVEGLLGGAEEFGAGALTKLAGPVGVGIAAAEAIKDTFDAVAKQSQEFEKDLGKGGIFSGEHGGIEGLVNAKNNLRAWGLNRFGVTTERNLAVAQAMQESGLNISGLAQKNQGMSISGVGDIADIAMKQAREIGLTDVEGTKQTIKLLQSYKMTLDGTQTFFRTVGKDITAAGLSTGKYLELIDDITSEFGDMAKSIESVTTILRLMGNTGTETYEQLKENFTALLGKPQTNEQQMFGFSMMPNQQYGQYAQAQQKIADMQAQKFADNLHQAINSLNLPKGSTEAIFKGLNLNTPAGMEEARSRFEEINRANGGQTNQYTTNIGALQKQAENAMVTAQGVKSGKFNASFIGDVTDANAVSRITNTLNTLNATLSASGTSAGEFMNNPDAIANNPALVKKISDATGLDAHKLLSIRAAVNDSSDSIIDELKSGLADSVTQTMKPDEIEALYARYLKMAAPNVKFAPGKAEETFKGMNTFDLKRGFREAMAQPGAFDEEAGATLVNKSLEAHHKESIDTQLKNNADLAEATRTTNDYLKSIEGALINKAGFLQNIFDFMNKKWGLQADVKTTQLTKDLAGNKNSDADNTVLQSIVNSVKPGTGGQESNWNFKDPAAEGAAKYKGASDILQHIQALEPGAKAGTLSKDDQKSYEFWKRAEQEMVNDFKLQIAPKAGNLMDDQGARIKAEQQAQQAIGLTYDKATGQVIPIKAANPVADAAPKVTQSNPTPGKVNSDNDNSSVSYHITSSQTVQAASPGSKMPSTETVQDTTKPKPVTTQQPGIQQ